LATIFAVDGYFSAEKFLVFAPPRSQATAKMLACD
jgi:hypothetical protein